MPAARVLCVDDEPGILLTLAQILSMSGYEVVTATSVSEALSTINSQKFDVLITDLNMGHAADGFTVVHAMRRVQPNCLNFILTGFPAFESALQALRAQVDDYFTKPSNIPLLLTKIANALQSRPIRETLPTHRLWEILRARSGEIANRTLASMKQHSETAEVPLADEERIAGLDAMLKDLADHLQSELPNEGSDVLLRSARRRGELRKKQHYPLKLMLEDERITQQVISNLMYEHLLDLDLSYLLLDMAKLVDARLLQQEESIAAYVEAERETR